MREGALHISLLGDSSWQLPGHAPVQLSPKDAALIAKLAIDGPQARAAMCELLWPESSAKQAETSLRQRASRLSRATGCRIIEVSAQVRLSDDVSVDALAIENCDDSVLLRTGPLLAGHDLGDSNELDRWLVGARERVTGVIVKALTDRAERLESAGRLRDALPLATRAVELSPLSEHGWRRLIRLHYLRNDLAAARDCCWRLTAALRDEFGVRPSEETLQLMQTVEAAERAGPLPRCPVPVSLLRPPVLIGRQEIWQAMSAAWQRPQPFLLIGEAGQGKSRLLEEFLQQQTGVIVERAQPGDDSSPYAVLGRILSSVHRQFSPDLSVGVRMELARIRPEFGRRPDSPADGPLLWHAVEQVLSQALDLGLTGVVIDDLHNSDVATLDSLCWLSARPSIGQLRLGLATRPLPEGPAAHSVATWSAASHHPVQLHLTPLTPQELSSLLASLALPTLLDAAITERLYRHAGGHLLFTLATLQDAIVRGSFLGPETWPQPTSIQALLDGRLRGLPDEAQALIRIAAVAGVDFTADRAARLLGKPLLDLVGAWSVLEAADVFRGESFSHDLVQESALRSVPSGVRRALHRELAELLATDEIAPPSRVAWHWEHGGRWQEAGRCWQAAADLARLAGRLDEQIALYERAASLHERSGNVRARFEALVARLEALRMRHGGAAALARISEVEALAENGTDRLRCQLARALAWLDGGHGEEAVQAAAEALREAEFHPRHQAEAGALYAQALAQCGKFSAALAAGKKALAAADAAAPDQRLGVLNALSYIHYAQGRLAEAVRWQREAIATAERQENLATAVIGEGNIAALLASIGDVAGTYAQARRTRERYATINIAENSSFGIVNHIILGTSAAALGRFDEALDALNEATRAAGEAAAPAAQAKARLALAQLWLTLGRSQDALSQLDGLPAQIIPGMAMQAALIRAKAAEQIGMSARRHLDELGRLAAQYKDLPLVQSAWFESSYAASSSDLRDTLRRVREQFDELGMPGTARSLMWRELVLWLESPEPEAAASALNLAESLEPHADSGTSAKCYPPEIWWTLARAFERIGDRARRADALASARRWIDAALPRVPEEYRRDFEQRNPINHRLLSASW